MRHGGGLSRRGTKRRGISRASEGGGGTILKTMRKSRSNNGLGDLEDSLEENENRLSSFRYNFNADQTPTPKTKAACVFSTNSLMPLRRLHDCHFLVTSSTRSSSTATALPSSTLMALISTTPITWRLIWLSPRRWMRGTWRALVSNFHVTCKWRTCLLTVIQRARAWSPQ